MFDNGSRAESGRLVAEEDDAMDVSARLGALEAFQAAVEKSRVEFSERLAEHEATLLRYLSVADEGTSSGEETKLAVLAAHRIAGVAPMFGFAELGALGHEVESALLADHQTPAQRQLCLQKASDLILQIKAVRAGETR